MRNLLALILFFSLVPPVLAAQVNGLYSASVLVDNQSQQRRNAALPIALNRVIQKITGSSQIPEDVGLRASISDVNSFVERFQYQKNENDRGGFQLRVLFQKQALDDVLQRHNLPIWGSNRPTVLVWLVLDDKSQGRYLVGSGRKELSSMLKGVAADSGLSIALPLLDADEKNVLAVDDVWNGNQTQIKAASNRYGVQHILYGHVIKTGQNSWQMRWGTIDKTTKNMGASPVNTVNQQTLERVLESGFSAATEKLALVYAPRGLQLDNVVALQISGIKGLADFSRVSSYLSSIESVKSVSWEALNEGKARFNIALNGNAIGLTQSVALSKVLSPDSSANQVIDMTPESNGGEGRSREIRVLYYRVN